MITIKDLNYQYTNSKTHSLDGINLQIPKGSLFGLLGPNGAGKTTLISILVGLFSGHTGSVSIAGLNLKNSSNEISELNI